MNIDEYREMIAKAESQTEDTPQVEETPVVETLDVVEEVPVEEVKQVENKLTVDGEEIDLDKVKEWKRGYMRNEDYTHKTQDLAKQRKEVQEAVALFENLRSNPDIAQEINQRIPVPQSLDPASAKVQELENRLYDLMVDREIASMQSKYSDFDAKEALEVATSKGLNNLEDAYLLIQANKPKEPVDIVDKSALEKELRAQIIAEMNATKEATQSIISTNDNSRSQVVTDDQRLTADELEYCRRSKTDPKEYAKWKKQ